MGLGGSSQDNQKNNKTAVALYFTKRKIKRLKN